MFIFNSQYLINEIITAARQAPRNTFCSKQSENMLLSRCKTTLLKELSIEPNIKLGRTGHKVPIKFFIFDAVSCAAQYT